MTVAERASRALGEAVRARSGPLLAQVLQGLTRAHQGTDDMVTTPPGAFRAPPLLDLDTTPYPAWMGQVAGLKVPRGLSTEAARAYVKGRGVSYRGTPRALLAAARTALTGTQVARLRERVGGNAYRATLITYASQTPDPAAVLRAAMEEKPVGIILDIEVRAGQTWGDVAAGGYTFGELKTLTVRQLREAAPRNG